MNLISRASQVSTKSKSISTQHLVLVGMFAAVLTIISQISIPLPTGVPITIQVFGIALVGAVLGWKLGCLATIVYILLGCVGGYILAWPIMAVLSGIRIKHENQLVCQVVPIVLAIVGLMVVEFVGGFQWSILTTEMSFGAIMAYSFAAFIPKDMVLTVLAVILGRQIRKPLVKAGYLK